MFTHLQIAIYTYHFGMLRILEKRFNLSSQQSSGLMSTGDAVQTVMALGLGYFARRAHKPRFISVSMVFLGAGCFLYALPYFVDGAKGSTGSTPGQHCSLIQFNFNLVDYYTMYTEQVLSDILLALQQCLVYIHL